MKKLFLRSTSPIYKVPRIEPDHCAINRVRRAAFAIYAQRRNSAVMRDANDLTSFSNTGAITSRQIRKVSKPRMPRPGVFEVLLLLESSATLSSRPFALDLRFLLHIISSSPKPAKTATFIGEGIQSAGSSNR